MTKKKNKDENKKDETKEIIKRRRHILCSSSSSFRPAYYFRPASRRFPQEYFSVCVVCASSGHVTPPIETQPATSAASPTQPEVTSTSGQERKFFPNENEVNEFFFFGRIRRTRKRNRKCHLLPVSRPPPREINRPSERIFSDWSQKLKKNKRGSDADFRSDPTGSGRPEKKKIPEVGGEWSLGDACGRIGRPFCSISPTGSHQLFPTST